MFCSKCGAKLEDDQAFCHQCGKRLDAPQQPIITQPDPIIPAPDPVAEAPVPAEPPAKKKSLKKKILIATAIVTALALVIGAVAIYLVNNPTVYLRTSIKEYDADGEWFRTVEYEYNDQGSPTEIKITSPDYDYEEVWDDENKIYIHNSTPNGGEQVRTITYEYNDEGHCRYYEDINKRYDASGELLETKTYDSTKALDYKYDYNSDDTIDEIAYRGLTLNDELGDYIGAYRYHYDDDGRLHEISNENDHTDRETIVSDFRYDKDGRLTASSYRMMEGMTLYEYEYNRDGQLETVSFSRAYSQAPFDDEHITDLSDYEDSKPSVWNEADFEYDDKGRLVCREIYIKDGTLTSTTELEYDGKYLSRVIFDDYTVEITDDEDEAEEIAEDMDDGDVVMVRDKHGNIIKAMNATGSYTEYEYEAVRLSKQLAQQHSSTMYSIRKVDLFGRSYSYIQSFTGGNGYVSYVAFPTNDLYEIEVLLKAKY